MNVNKKFDRLRQWGKEKLGAEVKTGTSEDFKALETEMNLRQDGLEKMHGAMGAYVKSLHKRVEGDGKEKSTAIASLGSAMTRHGEDFEESSTFGQCLLSFGQANEKIAKTQESYTTQASSSWLDALERSLAQMRDYQNARKKLDSRRLAYDTSLAKIQKAKKEDYRVEEELRSQKAKFEESTEDVQRRMQDIIESEQDNITDLNAFLEAELDYHDRCRDILLRLRNEWPIGPDPSAGPSFSRGPRSRENTISRDATAHSAMSAPEDNEDSQSLRRPAPPFRNSSRVSSANSSPQRELSSSISRSTPADRYPSRAQTPLSSISGHNPQQLRLPRTRTGRADSVFGDEDDDTSSSPEQHSFWEGSSTTRSSSPATTASYGASSRKDSWSALESVRGGAFGSNNGPAAMTVGEAIQSTSGTVKKAPPPPPPSRATKPRAAPPPPPLKRSALSTTSVPFSGV